MAQYAYSVRATLHASAQSAQSKAHRESKGIVNSAAVVFVRRKISAPQWVSQIGKQKTGETIVVNVRPKDWRGGRRGGLEA